MYHYLDFLYNQNKSQEFYDSPPISQNGEQL